MYERLIRVDYEEADFVKVLARNREQAGDIGGAVNYYRKALHRYINKRNYANIKEVWERLIEHRPDDTEFYLQLERKVARTVSEERAVALLEALYPHYYEEGGLGHHHRDPQAQFCAMSRRTRRRAPRSPRRIPRSTPATATWTSTCAFPT